MIEILHDAPQDVLTISATGQVTADDYKNVLIPAVERHIRRYGHVPILCIVGPKFEGISAGAAWEDLKFGVSHWSDMGRLAVVSDVGWIRDSALLISPFFHAPVRVFAYADLDSARQWLAEPPPAAISA